MRWKTRARLAILPDWRAASARLSIGLRHTLGGPRNTLSFAYLKGGQLLRVSGDCEVPMLVRILRTYRLPEILMLAAATLCVVVSAVYW
jgi:hypothetical protein